MTSRARIVVELGAWTFFAGAGCFTDRGPGSQSSAGTESEANTAGDTSNSASATMTASSSSGVTSMSSTSVTSGPTTSTDTNDGSGSDSGPPVQCNDGILAPGELCFDDAATWMGGDVTYSARLADIDSDGAQDALWLVSDEVRFALNDGSGAFGSVDSTGFTTFMRRMEILRGNDDGIPDLVVADPDQLQFALGNGGTGFVGVGDPTTTATMFALAVGDLDGDSLEDVVLATETTSISTYLGQGDGVYTSSWGANVFVTIPDLALAHLSDDDHLDLVYAADTATDSVRVRLGLGNGQFGAELLADADHPQVTSIAVGRFDGDERIDVAYLGPAAKTLGLLFGQAAGTFSAGTALAVAENPRFIESADLSNDGYHDLIVAYEGTSLELFMSNGDRTFAEPLSIALGFVPDSLALGEANGDGVPDIILSNENSENIRVQLSTP